MGERTRPDARQWLATLAGLAVVVAIGALDREWDEMRIIIGTVVIGPFVASLGATPRQTLGVGVVAVATVLASGDWNHDFGEPAYWLRASAVGAGAVVAVFSALARTRVARSRTRFALLANLAEIGEQSATPSEVVARLCELIVPAFADIAVFDIVERDQVRRLAVCASGPNRAETEAWLAARAPEPVETELSSTGAVRDSRARLVEDLTPEMMAALAHDDEDRERLLGLGSRSSITVPLRARGRVLGALSLTTTSASGRRFNADDAAFAEVMSGRAALALDNAGLFAELEATEAQLSAALGSLSDAVTVQTAGGQVVYANEAAARSMGFASAQELLATPTSEIVEQYDTFREDGTPLQLDDLPGRRVLTGERPEPVLVRAIHRATGEERWHMIKASAVHDPAGRETLAVNVIEDVTDVKRAEFSARLLADASELLSSSLDFERTLQQVAELAVPQLADWCALSMPDGRGHMRQLAVAHTEADKVRFARELSARFPTRIGSGSPIDVVLRTGEPMVLNDLTEEIVRASAVNDEHFELIMQLGMRAAMIVPMSVVGRVIGTLTLVSAESGRRFSDADLELARELARRAGVAVENARLYTERSNIAATLQAGLLPQALPDIPGFQTAALYRPAGEENWVGGDFYDAFPLEDGWLVVIGDVAGRGAAAASLTALARHTIRSVAQAVNLPDRALATLNRELWDRRGGALCTVAYAHLRADRVRIVCAGHPQPLLVRGGRAEQVGKFGPMLGAFEEATWNPVELALGPGDTLVLYTDGVIDTVGEHGRFGEARLRDTVEGARDAVDAVERVRTALAQFERGDQADDTAILAIARAAA